MSNCPCGSGSAAAACCEPILSGARRPDTAEQLMRARYTAFTKHDVDFLMRSVEPEQRKKLDRDSIKQWAEMSEWKGLEIRSRQQGGASDATGIVELVAKFSAGGKDLEHHEFAHFVRHEGAWFFDPRHSHGPLLPKAKGEVGRNDPCPCGSGKKWKKCCGAAA